MPNQYQHCMTNQTYFGKSLLCKDFQNPVTALFHSYTISFFSLYQKDSLQVEENDREQKSKREIYNQSASHIKPKIQQFAKCGDPMSLH